MINPIRAEEDVTVPVLITQEARQIAQQFARQQLDKAKAQQVCLNTLAIYAVNNYLKILSISADPSNCDSWNPLMRMTTNVADLEVTGLGRLECRPISAQERTHSSTCHVPTEVQSDRIAYVVVQIEPEQSKALLLGFVAHVNHEALPLNQLRPMSDLPVYLEQYNTQSLADRFTQLTNWMQGEIEAGWQTLENLFDTTSYNYGWRSTYSRSDEPSELSHIIRGKVLEVPTAWGIESIVLIAELVSKSEMDLGIEFKVAPADEQAFLPAGLEMTIMDADAEPVMHAQVRDENRTVELGFHAEPGDRFSLQIVLGDVTLNELFVV